MNNKKTNFRRLLVVLTAMLVGVTFISVSCSVDRLCHLEVVMKNSLPMELTIKTKDCCFVTTQDSSYRFILSPIADDYNSATRRGFGGLGLSLSDQLSPIL